MRYRELAAAKNNQAKLTVNVDHLWAVKEVEYDNIAKLMSFINRKWDPTSRCTRIIFDYV